MKTFRCFLFLFAILFCLKSEAQIVCPDLLPVITGGKWGFIDQEGNIKIEPLYDQVSKVYFKKYIIVHKNLKEGIIDINGNLIAGFLYENIIIPDTLNYFAMVERTHEEIIHDFDEDFDEESGFAEDGIEEPYEIADGFTGKMYGIFPFSGERLIFKTYPSIAKLNDSLYITKDCGYCGLISSKEEILPPIFQYFHLYDTLIFTRREYKNGCYSHRGKQILDEQYTDIERMDKFLVTRKTNKKALFCLKKQEFLTDHLFDGFRLPVNVNSHIFTVLSNNIGLITIDGIEILRAEYSSIIPCQGESGDARFFIVKKNNLCGIVNDAGKYIVEPEYDDIVFYDNNLFSLKKGFKYGVVNTAGNFLYKVDAARIQFHFGYIKVYTGNQLIIIEVDNFGNEKERFQYETVGTITVDRRFQSDEELMEVNASASLGDDVNASYGWYFCNQKKRWGMKDENDSILMAPIFKDIIDVPSSSYTVGIVEVLRSSKRNPEIRETVRMIGLADKFNSRLLILPKYDIIDIRSMRLGLGCNYFIGIRGVRYELIRQGKPDVHYNYIGECYDGYAVMNIKGKKTTALRNHYSITTVSENNFRNREATNSSQFRPQESRREHEQCLEFVGGKWGILNSDGDVSVLPVYMFLTNPSRGRVIARGKDKWGVISVEGDTIVPFNFDHIQFLKNSEDSMYLLKTSNRKHGLMDNAGNFITPCIFDAVYKFNDGMARVKTEDGYGYVDRKGDIVIETKYKRASDFSEGLAAVREKTLWGYIDTEGNQIIPMKYRMCGDFHNGMAWVYLNGKFGYINSEGEMVVPAVYSKTNDFRNNMAIVTKGDKKAIIDKNNNYIIKPVKGRLNIYDKEKVIVFSKRKKFVFYDFNGKKTGKLKANNLGDFSEGLASFSKNRKYGFVNIYGKMVVEPKFQRVENFHNERAAVYNQGKWGFIDKTGEIVVPVKYNQVFPFTDTVTAVRLAKDVIIIDKIGNIQCTYSDYTTKGFNDGYLLLKSSFYNLSFYINTSCEKIQNDRFSGIRPVSLNLFMGWNEIEKRWQLLDSKGNSLGYFYPEVKHTEKGMTYKYRQPVEVGEGMFTYCTYEYFRVADYSGRLIFDESFESVEYLGSGIYKTEVLNKTGYLHKDKGWIWEPQK